MSVPVASGLADCRDKLREPATSCGCHCLPRKLVFVRGGSLVNSASAWIDPEVIMEEWAKPDGRRAFHPIRAMFEGWQ
jgi:hypothetical protein